MILRQSFTCSACSVLIEILRSEKNSIPQACKTRSLHLKVLRGSALCSQRHPYQAVVATISLAVLSKLFNTRRILIRSSFQARFTCLNTSAILVYLCEWIQVACSRKARLQHVESKGGGEGLRHASHDLSKTSMRVLETADAKALLLWGEYMHCICINIDKWWKMESSQASQACINSLLLAVPDGHVDSMSCSPLGCWILKHRWTAAGWR